MGKMSLRWYLVWFVLLYSAAGENNTNSFKTDDDYYSIYEYDINNTAVEFHQDALLQPNPDSIDSKYTVDFSPKIDLPDDSLADPDLKDHDFIDNIMYIYYGSSKSNIRNQGSEIIIVGAVLSCAAQLLTLFCVLLKKVYKGRTSAMMFIVGNIFTVMFLSNLVFMLGVYATKNHLKCLATAAFLYFCHKFTLNWLVLYAFYIYRRLCYTRNKLTAPVDLYVIGIIAFGLPALLTATSVILDPQKFETKRFCFITIHSLFLDSYVVPGLMVIVSTVMSIIATNKIKSEASRFNFTETYSTESLRLTKHSLNHNANKEENNKQIISLWEASTCLRAICVIEVCWELHWYFTTLTLDRKISNLGIYFQFIVSVFLHWFIFVKKNKLMPLMEYTLPPKRTDEDTYSVETSTLDISSSSLSDSAPLLYSEDATEMTEFVKNDQESDEIINYNISTITTNA